MLSCTTYSRPSRTSTIFAYHFWAVRRVIRAAPRDEETGARGREFSLRVWVLQYYVLAEKELARRVGEKERNGRENGWKFVLFPERGQDGGRDHRSVLMGR